MRIHNFLTITILITLTLILNGCKTFICNEKTTYTAMPLSHFSDRLENLKDCLLSNKIQFNGSRFNYLRNNVIVYKQQSTFQCPYYLGCCSGEAQEPNIIYLYKEELFEHEFAHLLDILPKNHHGIQKLYLCIKR